MRTRDEIHSLAAGPDGPTEEILAPVVAVAMRDEQSIPHFDFPAATRLRALAAAALRVAAELDPAPRRRGQARVAGDVLQHHREPEVPA